MRRSTPTRLWSPVLSLLLLAGTIAFLPQALLPVNADSSYCASYGAAAGSAAANYSSCCGLSVEAAEYLLVAGPGGYGLEEWNSARAASIRPAYAACSSGQRCCPWTAPPTLRVWNVTGTDGDDGSGGTLASNGLVRYALSLSSNYSCVSLGSCCAAWECDAALGSARRFHEWSCEMGGCVERAAAGCSYEPLSPTRIMLLFVLPGVLVLLELLSYAYKRISGRLLLLDCTARGFNHEETLANLGPFLLRPWAFRSLVLLNFLLPAAAHLVNAARPLDSCAVTGVTRWAGYIYAIGYVVAAGIAALWRASNTTETGRFHDVWIDVLVSTHLVHAVPLGISMALGPGQSWLDHAILAHQAVGLRWIVLALPAVPCMVRCRPTHQGHTSCYASLYRLLDVQAWRAGIDYFDRDDAALRGGYNRRKPGWGSSRGEHDKALVFGPAIARARIADQDPQRRAVALHLAGMQEYVLHWDGCGCGAWSCWARLLVHRAEPEYQRADQFIPPVLPSSPLAKGKVPHTAGPFSVQMGVVRPVTPPQTQWQQPQQQPQHFSYPRAEERPWQPDAVDPDAELPHSVPQSDVEADETAVGSSIHPHPHPDFFKSPVRSLQFSSALNTPAQTQVQAHAAEAHAAAIARAHGRKHLQPLHPSASSHMPRTPSPNHMAQHHPALGQGDPAGLSTPSHRSHKPSPQHTAQQRVFREALRGKKTPLRRAKSRGADSSSSSSSSSSSEDDGPVERPFEAKYPSPPPPSNPRSPAPSSSHPAPPSPPPRLNSTLERLRPPQLFTGASTPMGAAPSTPAITTPVVHVPAAQRAPATPQPHPQLHAGSADHGPSAPLTRSRVQDGTYVPAENLLLAAPQQSLGPQLQFEEGIAKTATPAVLVRRP